MNNITRPMTDSSDSDRSATRPPVIGVPLANYLEHGGWMGGTVYVVNMMEALATLPAGRRPPVRLIGVEDESSPLLLQLARYDFVEIARGADGTPLGLDDPAVADSYDALFPCRKPVDPALKPVYWIPDLQHRHLPGNFTQQEIADRDAEARAMLSSGAPVIVSSGAVARDLAAFYPDVAARIAQFSFCSGIHRLPAPDTDVRAAYGLPEKFIYLPNQFWIHKDHPLALEAVWRLRATGIEVPVVMSGPTQDYRAPDYFQKLMEWIATNKLDDLVTYIGVVPREEQREVFRLAAAVLQPSRFEGWSTTVEDAKSLGKTIIASDLPVHHEQIGDAGIYFQTGNATDLIRVLGEAWPNLSPGPDADAERRAAEETEQRRTAMGAALCDIAQSVRAAPAPAPRASTRPAYPDMPAIAPGLCRVPPPGETAWYPPPLAGAATVAKRLTGDAGYIRRALALYETLSPDEYTRYLTGYYRDGLERFGDQWVYADIVTALLGLSEMIQPRRYLEIGVRRGRSACAVASAAPDCDMALFDMWMADYAGMENPGPDLVREELAKVGHRGACDFIDGNSHQTIPAYFEANADATFDMITVDGDHTDEGAARDLRNVLPRLSIGGAVVFDDIAHPAHPGLAQVWYDIVAGDPRFSSWAFGDAGYGIGFAVRLR